MKAPTDKANDTIQIIVTRVCDLQYCSNCTQLLPFRSDPAFMSVDVFRAALRSLAGWPGIRGVFGGNPAVHPKFPDLCQVLIEEVPDQRQRGLWCNNLMGHGQIVRDTFYPHARFNLNAHANTAAADEIEAWLPGKLIKTSRDRASWHSPILIGHRDVGISDEAWPAIRETCDINRTWSAAIAERDGKPWAYFCEVAAALDGIRGQNHGIPAAPGWWKLKMDAFRGQVRGCCDAGCGVPLKGKGHLDTENTYDYSASFAPLVELTIGRRPVMKGQRHEAPPATTQRVTDYQLLHANKKPAGGPRA